ncbi:MAG: tetratricopeptide repeat protein, partial [Mycoplasmataceae bacterium]|nr:tetratricopeptide repeat protein [Mycoplasmataceae bacterium]
MSKEKKFEKIDDFFDYEIKEMKHFYIFLDLLNKVENKFIFRGQSNSNLNVEGKIDKFNEWNLDSSLRRKFKDNNEQNNSVVLNMATNGMIKYIEDRIPEEKSELNILAEMQHFGNPTTLIDFTKDILHALFFSFHNENFSYFNSGYVNIFLKKIDKDIKYSLYNKGENKDKRIIKNISGVFYCPKNIIRGVSQKSLFIFDNKDNLITEEKIKKIKISYTLKKEITSFLKSKAIDNESIFPDLEGIYKDFFINDENIIFIKGNSLLDKKRNEEAIEKFKKVTEINPKYSNAYFNWGFSLDKLENFDEAIEKFKKVTEINPKYSNAYSNWGIALIDLGNTLNDSGKSNEAIEKFNEA